MPLIEQFHAFYADVLSIQEPMSAGRVTPVEARDQLVRHLQRQEMRAERKHGASGVELFRRAEYAMAAMADEYFLRPESAVRDAWSDVLLESALFRSRLAGEKFFTQIEELHELRGSDAADLASVYLAILGLGFQGRFRGQQDSDERLEQYRHKLFRVIYAREPEPAATSESKIAPNAYEVTAEYTDRLELPYLRPWLIALALVIVVWIAAGHVIWEMAIEPLEASIQSIAPHTANGAP